MSDVMSTNLIDGRSTSSCFRPLQRLAHRSASRRLDLPSSLTASDIQSTSPSDNPSPVRLSCPTVGSMTMLWHCMKYYASSCGRAACTTDQVTSEPCENIRNEVTSKKTLKLECRKNRLQHKIYYCINKD